MLTTGAGVKLSMRRLCVCLFIMGLLLAASYARADGAPSLVLLVEGPDHEAVERELRASVRDVYTEVDGKGVRTALARVGHKGPVGPAMADDPKRAMLKVRLEVAARDAHVDDVAVVTLARDAHGSRRAHFLIVDVPSSSSSDTSAVFESGDGAIGSALLLELSHFSRALVSAAGAPTRSETPAALPAVPSSGDTVLAPRSPPRERGHELLVVQGGPEVGARHLRYIDAISSSLRSYDLGAAPLVAASAGIYPFADQASAVDGGVAVGYAQAFVLSSTSGAGDAVQTHWSRFHVGLRARARVGSGLVLGAGVAYGGETFGFSSSALESQVPAVAYRFVRPSLDARVIFFGRFALTGSAAYDAVLSAGSVADRFPHAGVGGFEAALGPAFALSRAWELGVTASYRRFFYAMHPAPGDAHVAGGALDEMLGLQASVSYIF